MSSSCIVKKGLKVKLINICFLLKAIATEFYEIPCDVSLKPIMHINEIKK